MTNKETVNRNIGLTFDFLRQIIKNPSILDKIPNGSTIEFIEKDFSKTENGTSKANKKYLKVKSEFELI